MLRVVALALFVEKIWTHRVDTQTGQEIAADTEETSNETNTGFDCPEECVSCCKRGLTSNRKWFTCLLRDGLRCPKGRQCGQWYRSHQRKLNNLKTTLGVHQRIALGAFKTDVFYTEEELAKKKSLKMCHAYQFFGPTLQPPGAGPEQYSSIGLAETPDAYTKLPDEGWLPAPAKGMDVFHCPPECTECCGGPGKFTCILNTGELSADLQSRNCKAPSKRHKTDGFKTICQFTSEERALPRKAKQLGACADRYKCCCPLEDHWTEEVCMPFEHANNPLWMMSNIRGTKELFMISSHQKHDNRATRCVSGAFGRRYDRPAPLTGCCLKTHRYCCRHCDDSCCKYCDHCDLFEKIFICTADGGKSPAGNVFRRVASSPGTCLPNRGQEMRKIMTLNKPDETGNYRLIPLPELRSGKPRRLMLEASECPVGSFEMGADKTACRCLSNKPSCSTGPAWANGKGIKPPPLTVQSPILGPPMGQPAMGPPMGQQPMYNQQPGQQPMYNLQPGQQPMHQQPGQQPMYQQPGQHYQPVYGQQPMHQQPGQQPMYQQR